MKNQDTEANKPLIAKQLQMTPERKERMDKAFQAVLDVLADATDSPLEGYVVLEAVTERLKESLGVVAVHVVEHSTFTGEGGQA